MAADNQPPVLTFFKPKLFISMFFLIITPPVLKFPFFSTEILYFQLFLFLIMSHESQNHEISAIKFHQI